MDNIKERKEGVENELFHMNDNQQSLGSAKSKLSFEEKFGQFKQGKGSLNTRQVFQLMRNEEKKQKKVSLLEMSCYHTSMHVEVQWV